MIAVLICGLVRDEAKFKEKVQTYSRWRIDGYINNIIYATWIGEVDRYAGLRRFIEEESVQLLEIEEPKLVLKGGHQLHQMLALHYGLEAIKDNSFVLKTRVDLADNNDVMLPIFKKGTDKADDFLGLNLESKVLVETARMELPFLCTDAQFFGRRDDLKKLVSLSTEFELLYNNLAVEQCFFFNPFRCVGIFKRHFYWNLPHFSEIANDRTDQYKYIISQPLLMDVLVSWWIVLESYFQIGWMPKGECSDEFDSLMDAFNVDGLDKRISVGDASGIINYSCFVKRLLTLIGEDKVAMTKERLLSNNEDYSSIFVDPSVFDVYEDYRKRFSKLPSPKASRWGDRTIIRGVPQHFFVKSDNDSASARYHEQITFLRREIDALQYQLKVVRTHSWLHRLLSRILSSEFKENLRRKYPRIISIYMRYFMKKSVPNNEK